MQASDIDLRRLRQLLAVVDAGGVREASRRIHIAQPALSRTVAELEEALGLALFERSGRRMVVTPAGRAVADDARALLGEAEAMIARARAMAGGTEGQLRLGCSPSAIFHPRVPEALRALEQARPGLALELAEGSTSSLLEKLLAHGLDGAFVRPAAALPPGLDGALLEREPLYLAVAVGHPLAGKRAVRAPAMFEHPLLLPSPSLGSSLGAVIDRLSLAHGAQVRVAAHATHVASLVHLAAAGMGVAVVPASLRLHRVRGVRFVRLASAGARLPLVLARRSGSTSPALAALVALAKATGSESA